MTNHNHSKKKKACTECQCCGPTSYEFPDELLTPELKKLKESMTAAEFEELMKSMM
jgi:hypothetical protein